MWGNREQLAGRELGSLVGRVDTRAPWYSSGRGRGLTWLWVTSNVPVIPGEGIGFEKCHLDSESVLLIISYPGCGVLHTGTLSAVWLAHPCLMDRCCSQWSRLSSLCFGYFEAGGLIPSGDICLFLLSEQSHFFLGVSCLVFWSLASQKTRPHVSLVIHCVWTAPPPPSKAATHGLFILVCISASRKKDKRLLWGPKLKNSLQKVSLSGQDRPQCHFLITFFPFFLRCLLYEKKEDMLSVVILYFRNECFYQK